MNETQDEWLTISAAATKLGMSDRQARRHAVKLSDTDRRMSDGSPTRVRLSALAVVSDRPTPEVASVGHATDTEGKASDSATDNPADARPTPNDASAQQVKDLQSQVADLKRDKEQLMGLLDKALTTINSQDQRVQQLETLEAKLIQALPSPVPPDDGHTSDDDRQASDAPLRAGLWAKLGALIGNRNKA